MHTFSLKEAKKTKDKGNGCAGPGFIKCSLSNRIGDPLLDCPGEDVVPGLLLEDRDGLLEAHVESQAFPELVLQFPVSR